MQGISLSLAGMMIHSKKMQKEPKLEVINLYHYSSVASSTRGARSRFTAPEVSGAAVAVVVAEGADSTGLEAGDFVSLEDFLDFFFFLFC
jgi:hypothetical protein